MLRIEAGERVRVALTVNGRARSGHAEPRTLLSDFLRHELGLYGTHVGCEHGVCGACTVLIDGRAERSCMTFAVQAEGAAIVTVEGLADSGLNDLQQAFSRHGALQCGYCTPGVLASCTELLRETPAPSESEVRDMLAGHICRCTGYQGMVDAVLEVAKRRATPEDSWNATTPRAAPRS